MHVLTFSALTEEYLTGLVQITAVSVMLQNIRGRVHLYLQVTFVEAKQNSKEHNQQEC